MSNVSCPHCNGLIQADPRLAGHLVSCPHCQRQLQMPAASIEISSVKTPPLQMNTGSDAGPIVINTRATTAQGQVKKRTSPLAIMLPIALGVLVLCGGALRGLMQVSDSGNEAIGPSDYEDVGSGGSVSARFTQGHADGLARGTQMLKNKGSGRVTWEFAYQGACESTRTAAENSPSGTDDPACQYWAGVAAGMLEARNNSGGW